MIARREAIAAAGAAIAMGIQTLRTGTPHEAAQRAHTPGGLSVDELEQRIVRYRAESLSQMGEDRAA